MNPLMKIVYFLMFFNFATLVVALPNPISPKPSKLNKVTKATRPNVERYDDSVNEYLTERTCWWNEMCKEEFSTKFRCRCPLWSFCSSPGRYYNAYCTMSGTGYLWTQPKSSGAFFKQPYKPKRNNNKT